MAPGILETPTSDAAPAAPLASFDPLVIDKLDPEFVRYYAEVLQFQKPTHEIPISEIRANPDKHAAPWVHNSKDDVATEDIEITSADGYRIPVRAYHPDAEKYGAGPYGVHINFHGGGFVFGSLDADSAFCNTIRERVGVVVVDVNYRHCPEAPYGKNIEDTWASLNWVRSSKSRLNIDPNSVSLGGISAGGFFTLVLQHMARDHGIPLRLIIPAVPVATDCCSYKSPKDSAFGSFQEFSHAPLLNWARMSYFQEHVFPDDKVEHLRSKYPVLWLSPLEAPNFAGLCDSFIITAECDPVRDEAEAYGMKLLAAGNKVTLKRYLGVPHPFMHMTSALTKAREYDNDVVAALRAAHTRL